MATTAAKVAETAEEVREFVENADGVRIVQYTAVWCKNCGVIKEALAAELPAEDVKWMIASIDIEDLPPVAKLPRVDVLGGGEGTVTLEGFNCKVENILFAMRVASGQSLEMSDDF